MSLGMHTPAGDLEFWMDLAEDRERERNEARARVEQVEAQLAVARKALDVLEKMPADERDIGEWNAKAIAEDICRAHNLLDDALEWPSPKAQALLDMVEVAGLVQGFHHDCFVNGAVLWHSKGDRKSVV